MDFAIDDDTRRLCEGARDFLEGENDVKRLRQAEDATGFELWPQIAELGLLAINAATQHGGLGLGALDAAVLAEEAGRVALPEPLVETAGLVVPALESLGQSELVLKLLKGDLKIAVASPLNPYVNHIDQLDAVLLVMPTRISLASTKLCPSEPNASIDPWRRLSQVDLKATGEVLAKSREAKRISHWIEAQGAVLASAELCGLASTMLEMASEYAKTREQFGVAIGSFQAVKHLLADIRVRLEFARPVVYRAAAAMDEEGYGHRDKVVSHAKVAATDAAILAAENAIQVFGGMGYTFEADLHYFMKRSWALAGIWGDREYHLERLEGILFAEDALIGPGASYSAITT